MPRTHFVKYFKCFSRRAQKKILKNKKVNSYRLKIVSFKKHNSVIRCLQFLSIKIKNTQKII